ncbi:MAG: DUF742 domain-containing protein [Actinomycetes bacterium]
MPDHISDDAPGRHDHHLYGEELVEDARVVRPYALTRGRTRPGRADLPLEALVCCVDGARDPVGTSERRRILELTGDEILSIAELSAHLSLPLGVVRVLVGDLADEGLVVVHSGSPTTTAPATNLKVLESVLNGISSL